MNRTIQYEQNQTNVILLETDYADDLSDYLDQTVLEIKVNVKNRRRKKPPANYSYDTEVVVNETYIDQINSDYDEPTTEPTTTTLTTQKRISCLIFFIQY